MRDVEKTEEFFIIQTNIQVKVRGQVSVYTHALLLRIEYIRIKFEKMRGNTLKKLKVMIQQGHVQKGCAKASELLKHPVTRQGENDACVAQAIFNMLGLFTCVEADLVSQ